MLELDLILAIQLNYRLSKARNDALSSPSIMVPSWDQETENHPRVCHWLQDNPIHGRGGRINNMWGATCSDQEIHCTVEELRVHVLRLHKCIVFIVYQQTAWLVVILDFRVFAGFSLFVLTAINNARHWGFGMIYQMDVLPLQDKQQKYFPPRKTMFLRHSRPCPIPSVLSQSLLPHPHMETRRRKRPSCCLTNA